MKSGPIKSNFLNSILIIVLTYILVNLIVEFLPSSLKEQTKTTIGGLFGISCQPITKVSRSMFGHTFTTEWNKGVYNFGETATITITLDPGLSQFERSFLPNETVTQITTYKGNFDGNECVGEILSIVQHSSNNDRLVGIGKITFTETSQITFGPGCICIKSETLNSPQKVEPLYFQIEVLGTTTTTETTTTTVPTTTSSSTTTIPETTTTQTTTTTTEKITTETTTTTIPTSEKQLLTGYKRILIIFFVGIVLSLIGSFLYLMMKPNQYDMLKRKW